MAIDKIGSKALVDCSVAAADIAPGTITDAKLAGSIANAKLANTTVTINGTAIALGASASINPVSWQSVVVSDGSTVTTMVAGRGYFVDNTSAAGLVLLPSSASAGDTIAIKDYAGNFGTNNLTIQRNSHNIQGVANDSLISTNRSSVQLVYIDATKGWLYTNESNVADLENVGFISATGGTVTTSGNFKIHTFTGDSNFVVASTGFPTPANNDKVDYLVVAGGGGGGRDGGGGGGAGGFRVSNVTCMSAPQTSPLASPTGIAVTAQTYPITVGAGGPGDPAPSANPSANKNGSNSVFSTITSAGGGGAGSNCYTNGANGGSGGGGSRNATIAGDAGSGNTPPVSPPQGNDGNYHTVAIGGGGGGADPTGASPAPGNSGNGGTGSFVVQTGFAGCNGTPGPVSGARYFSGGGVGGHNPSAAPGASQTGGTGGGGEQSPPGGAAGTANTGGGGGAGDAAGSIGQASGAGGKGIVIIRYKFQ